MIRTQVYLPKPLYEDIKLRAKAKGKPAAQLIREALEKEQLRESLGKNKAPDKKRRGLAALADLKLTGGPTDLSRRIDDYLYGDE